jgi:hypothetical protein
MARSTVDALADFVVQKETNKNLPLVPLTCS